MEHVARSLSLVSADVSVSPQSCRVCLKAFRMTCQIIDLQGAQHSTQQPFLAFAGKTPIFQKIVV